MFEKRLDSLNMKGSLKERLLSAVTNLYDYFAHDLRSAHEAFRDQFDKMIDDINGKLDASFRKSWDLTSSYINGMIELFGELYEKRLAKASEEDVKNRIKALREEYLKDVDRVTAERDPLERRRAFLFEKYKELSKRLTEESKAKYETFRQEYFAALKNECLAVISDFYAPFDQPEKDEDGKIIRAIMPHKHPDAIPYAVKKIGDFEVAEMFNPSRLTVFEYGEGAAEAASNIVTNLIYHSFFTFAPDVKIVVWKGSYGISRDWDGGLLSERLIDRFVLEFRSFYDFKRAVEEHLSNRRRDVMLVAIMMPPEDETREEYREFMSMLGSECGVESKFAFVCLANKISASAIWNDAPAVSACRFGKDFIKVDDFDSVPVAIRRDRENNVRVMQALLEPPARIIPGTLAIPFGRDASKEMFSIPYTASNASAMFIFGATGTGKTFTLDNFVYNTAKRYSPSVVQFMLIDCKDCVDMIKFGHLPHAQCVMNADVDILVGLTKNIWKEMNERNRLFRELKCRNIDEYNERRAEGQDLKPLPRILVVIDEFAYIAEKQRSGSDQEKRAAKRFIEELSALVKKTRSAGIHYLCATQTSGDAACFDRGVFNYTATLRNDFGRYSVDFQQGDERFSSSNSVRLIPENIKVTDSLIFDLAEKWKADALCRKPVICADTDTLPRVEDFPGFDDEAERYFGNASEDEIFLPAGVNLQNIFSLLAVPYGSSRGSERPHLLVTGNCEYRNGDELYETALRRFLETQLWSADKLSRKGRKIRVSLLDKTGFLEGTSEIIRRYDNLNDAVEAWKRTRAEDPDVWNFLVITKAEDVLVELSRSEREAFKAKFEVDKSSDVEREVFPSMKNDDDLDAGMQVFAMMDDIEAAPQVVKEEYCDALSETTACHPLDVILNAAKDPTRSKSIMIIHSTQPQKMNDFFKQDDGNFANFRFASFRCTNDPLVRGVDAPTSFKIGAISDSCTSEEDRSNFMPFITMPKES